MLALFSLGLPLEQSTKATVLSADSACSAMVKVSGSFPADAHSQVYPLATKAQAASHRASMVSEMRTWAVCALADGQIDGPGHGGQIEDSQQGGYDCAFTCASEPLLPDGHAACESWCSKHSQPWNVKCAWNNGHCSSCSQCKTESVTKCEKWCSTHTASWATKCGMGSVTWGHDYCMGCEECKTASHSTCQYWCAKNSKDWATKCAWKTGVCSTCSNCDPSA